MISNPNPWRSTLVEPPARTLAPSRLPASRLPISIDERPITKTRVSERRRVVRTLSAFLALFGAVWVIFYAIHRAFPYIRPGADQISEAKYERVKASPLFAPNAKRRVVIFGVSTTLSGFKPDLFDQLSGGRTSSYNLGIHTRWPVIEDLEAMIARGETPTDILFAGPWPGTGAELPVAFHPVQSDREIVSTLFPFHSLPRDLFVFFALAPSRGGVHAFYQKGRQSVQDMLAHRGWYFIEAQSLYPDHRLPDDFKMPTDDPTRPDFRHGRPIGRQFDHLYALMEKHNIRGWCVPDNRREGGYATDPYNVAMIEDLKDHPRIKVVGPDYHLFPKRFFSDAVHLNPDGADAYTRKLWDTIGSTLVAD